MFGIQFALYFSIHTYKCWRTNTNCNKDSNWPENCSSFKWKIKNCKLDSYLNDEQFLGSLYFGLDLEIRNSLTSFLFSTIYAHQVIYRMRAITMIGLYTFYSLFEVHLCTVTFGLMNGQYSIAVSNQQRVIVARVLAKLRNCIVVCFCLHNLEFSMTHFICTLLYNLEGTCSTKYKGVLRV